MDNPYQAPNADLQSTQSLEALRYVGFWARTGAYIVDSLLMMVIILPIFFLMLGGGGLEQMAAQSEAPGIGMILVMYVLPILLVLGFWMIKGATPGKMIFKAKIVDAKTGDQPSKLQFIGRYFGYIISSIPLGLGFYWVGWDKRKQGWHDKMSGTVVVAPSNDPDKQISFNG